jgi:uncharacterized protein YcnI
MRHDDRRATGGLEEHAKMNQMPRTSTSNRERALRRALPAIFIVFLWASAPAAHGHAVVQPTASRPAEQQVYTLTVPNERDSDVVSVALQVSPDIDSLLVEEKPGWSARLQREGDRVAVVRWSGGRIGGDQYDTFRFIARNPVQAGELEWKVIQRYTDATDRWIGPADSEQPAARTTISERATPVDVINTEESGAASPESPADTSATGGGDGGGDGDSNTVPIVIAVVALVAALAALGVALAARRRPRA